MANEVNTPTADVQSHHIAQTQRFFIEQLEVLQNELRQDPTKGSPPIRGGLVRVVIALRSPRATYLDWGRLPRDALCT